MSTLPIHARLSVQKLSHGSGFQAFGIRAPVELTDPFLMVDHYRMSQPTFGPHPHAGFSAVTYMFDDAETGFHNRDSRGDDSMILPGDTHWTIAGAGVVHDEVPIVPGKVAHGLQMFVNLAAHKKWMPPAALHTSAAQRPTHTQAGGAQVRVALGQYDDGQTQLAPAAAQPTEATVLDIQLAAGHAFAYPVPAGHTAFMLGVSGALACDDQAIAAGQAVAFARIGGELRIQAVTDAQFAVFLGAPLGEPVVQHGPFAMSTQADIAQVIHDYQAGRMGRLQPL
jgi:redox-sensitive bicupin YhaK (pirin superfamily)